MLNYLMKPIYLGLVGPIASGKGMVAEYLKTKGFNVFSLSDRVREEATKRGLALERENLQDVGDDLRLHHGNHVLAERTLAKIEHTDQNTILDSIRNPGEIKYLRHSLGLFLDNGIKVIGIDAPVDRRIDWYIKRAAQRGEDNPDMSVFIKSSLRDGGIDQPLHGQQVEECLKLTDIRFWNLGTPEDLYSELNKYLKREFNFDPEVHRQSKEK